MSRHDLGADRGAEARHSRQSSDSLRLVDASCPRERGAGLAEYGLLATLVAVVCVVVVAALGPIVSSMIADFTAGSGG